MSTVWPSDVQGLLCCGCSALVNGRVLTTKQGFFVLPKFRNGDFTEEFQIMVWIPVPPCQIYKRSRVAQLVYFHVNPPGSFLLVRSNSTFDFTKQSQISWAQSLSSHRPTLKRALWRQNKKLQIAGILNVLLQLSQCG